MSVVERFVIEVLDLGAEACLPRNLPDLWLQLLARSMEVIVSASHDSRPGGEPLGTDCDPGDYLSDAELPALGIAALLSILRARSSTESSIHVSWDALWRYVTDYHIELGFEVVHRHTDLKYEAASLETIFTNRLIRTWRE